MLVEYLLLLVWYVCAELHGISEFCARPNRLCNGILGDDEELDSYRECGFFATRLHWGTQVYIDTSNPKFGTCVQSRERLSIEFKQFVSQSKRSIRLKFSSAEESKYVAQILELFAPYEQCVDVIEIERLGTASVEDAVAVLVRLEQFKTLSSLRFSNGTGIWAQPNSSPALNESQVRELDEALAKLFRELTVRDMLSISVPDFASQESLDVVLTNSGVSVLLLGDIRRELSWSAVATLDRTSSIELPHIPALSEVLGDLQKTGVNSLSVQGISNEDLALIAQNQNISNLRIRSAIELNEEGLNELRNLENLKTLVLYEGAYSETNLAGIKKWAAEVEHHYKLKLNREIEIRIHQPLRP